MPSVTAEDRVSEVVDATAVMLADCPSAKTIWSPTSDEVHDVPLPVTVVEDTPAVPAVPVLYAVLDTESEF